MCRLSWWEKGQRSALPPLPGPRDPHTQIPQGLPMGSGLYLSQLDGQRHFEGLYPHFHGQHVVVACGAPGAMGNTSCGDRGV